MGEAAGVERSPTCGRSPPEERLREAQTTFFSFVARAKGWPAFHKQNPVDSGERPRGLRMNVDITRRSA